MTAPFDESPASRGRPQQTAADLLARIDADLDLRPTQRRDLRASLMLVVRESRRDPGSIPAELTTIMALAEEAIGLIPLSPKRRANVLSDLRRLAQRYGLISGNEWRKLPPSSAWQAFIEPVTDKYDRGVLLPFARFCSSIAIEPTGVTDEVAARYRDALSALGRSQKRTRIEHQTLCRRWNGLPNRPTETLELPRYREFFCLADDEFPPSLWRDLDIYLARLGADNLLGRKGPLKPLRPASIKAHRFRLRFFASALVHAGVAAQNLTSLADLVADDRFVLAAEYLFERSKRQPSQNVSQALWSAYAMAHHYLELPADGLETFGSICNQVTPRRAGMTRKNQRRLTEASSPEVLDRLLAYPVEVMRRIEKHNDGSYRTALKYQLALAIEILLHALVRIHNLAGLHIDDHFDGLNRKDTYISLDEDDVKNGNAMLIPLPPHLARHINFYVQKIRPRFDPEGSRFLFPGRGRPDKRSDTMSRQIAETTQREIGVRLNAHLFRHLGAHLKLTDRPGDYGGASRVLGHTSMNTAYRTYTGPEGVAAFRHLENIIAAKRSQGRSLPRRRKA